MFKAARRGVDRAAGVQLGARQNWVFLIDRPWVVLGDVNAAHGFPPHVPGPDRMAQGSPFVFIDNIPVCRMGHRAGCGNPTTGSGVTWVET